MKFFMLYPNQFAVGNKPIGIASLAAILKSEGHQFELFDCTQYQLQRLAGDTDTNADWNLAGARTLAFKHPTNAERLPIRPAITYRQLIDRLIAAIDAFKPDIIGMSALTDDYPLGLGLMREVRRAFPSIPTISGGVHATVDPENVLREDCFDMVCVGEGEYVVLDIAERVKEKKSFEGIPNLWVKHPDGSVERNTVRPYEQNLDLFPFPDWSIFPETAFYKPFLGTVYKYGDFEMSRGCPYKCSYCINVQLQEIYRFAGSHNFHREKSIPRVIAEIERAIEEYGIEFLKFWDETFLLMSEARMEEFRDLYAPLRIPYVIETTGQSITPFSAGILKETNCKSASLGMETGSPDMRKGLLSKPTDNSVYQTAFDLLGESGVQKVSFNMIGLPNESQEDIFRTIALNRLTGTETQSIGIFYPYKGTPIRTIMVEQDLMDDDFEFNDLQGYDFNTFTAGNRSVVKFRDMDSVLLNRLWSLFSSYCLWPVKLFPLIDYVKNNNDALAVSLLINIQNTSYFKKFGEMPPDFEDEATAGAHPKPQGNPPAFSDPNTAEFAEHIWNHWTGPGAEQLGAMLTAIADGDLHPEFDLPEDNEKLVEWLEEGTATSSVHREERAALRRIAQERGKAYATASQPAE